MRPSAPMLLRSGSPRLRGIDGISESLDEALLGVLYRSGEIEAIKPDQVGELKGCFRAMKIMQAILVLADLSLRQQKAMEYIRNYGPVAIGLRRAFCQGGE